MAQWAVARRSATINLACRAFGISQTCCRYNAKLDAENSLIADWMVRLTNNQRNWGFGLCFLYLRNVKGFRWNHLFVAIDRAMRQATASKPESDNTTTRQHDNTTTRQHDSASAVGMALQRLDFGICRKLALALGFLSIALCEAFPYCSLIGRWCAIFKRTERIGT
jgi:hypothetical protein